VYDPEGLPEKLKRAREYSGLKLRELAEKLDVHITAVQKWEKGINHPNARDLAKIAELENLDLNYYFDPAIDEPKKADLSYREFVTPLQAAYDRIEKLKLIEQKAKAESPVLRAIADKPVLAELLEKVYELPEIKIAELKGMLLGYLERQEREKEEAFRRAMEAQARPTGQSEQTKSGQGAA
jgi:transcriptional regulator with XRE-family HTH domain